MQAGGAGLQRTQHDAVAGQDQAAQKAALGVQRLTVTAIAPMASTSGRAGPGPADGGARQS